MAKNKDMKESLQKFRQEADKLEQSDALKSAREKFHTVEEEATKSSEVLRGKFEGIKDKVQEAIEEAGKSDIAKKAGQYYFYIHGVAMFGLILILCLINL